MKIQISTQRNAIKLRHSTQSTIDGRENYFKAMFLLLLFLFLFSTFVVVVVVVVVVYF